jgi:hypothetical protein
MPGKLEAQATVRTLRETLQYRDETAWRGEEGRA